MSVLYEHKFAGGTAIRFVDKPFEAAKKEVLTVEIDGITTNDRIGTFFAFLFDNDTKEDLAKNLYIALHQRYNPTLSLYRDVICKTCQTVVCENCRRLAQVQNSKKGKLEQARLVEVGQYRKTGKYKGRYAKYGKKKKVPMVEMVNPAVEEEIETIQIK